MKLIFLSASAGFVLATASAARSITLEFNQVIGNPMGDPSQPENLLLPQGIAIEEGTSNIYIGDSEKARVAVFDPQGNYLFDFGQTQITGETANVEFNRNSGQLFVGDVDGNEIDVFEPDGTYVRSFGEFTIGTERPFEGPAGLGFSPDFEQFYVANYAGDEIIVFDSVTGTVINTIGTGGQEPGQLFGPAAVAVSPTGNLYVSEQLNSRIQVLTPEGESLRTFGIPRPGPVVDPFAPVPPDVQPGEISSPVDVALDEFENVYVADLLNNRVQVFNSQGEFLTLVDELPTVPSTYTWIVGTEYNDGKLYTSDFINNRVVVFDVENNETVAAASVPEPSSAFGLAMLALSVAGAGKRGSLRQGKG